MEIKSATQIDQSVAREKMSEIFVNGFSQHFVFFTKDKHKLAKALEHMFNLDQFYVALIDGEIAGMAACTNGKVSSVTPDSKELKKHFGWYKGTIAAVTFGRDFRKPPIEVGEGKASVEFVATSPQFRGKGIATKLIKYFYMFPQYKEYILEVADTNINAVNLYTKLGFKEFTRKKQLKWLTGINYLLYMKYTK